MKRIKHIAKEAHLSENSVIKYFMMSSYLTDKKRSLIKATMESLDYTFEELQQKVATISNNKENKVTLGLLIRSLSDSGMLEAVEKAELKAETFGYKLVIMQTKGDKERETSFLEMMKENIVSGMVMFTMENNWSDIELYQEYGPIVCCSQYVSMQQHAQFFTNDPFTKVGYEEVIKIDSTDVVYATLNEEQMDENINGWNVEELEHFTGSNSSDILNNILLTRKNSQPKIILTKGSELTDGLSKELYLQNEKLAENSVVIDILDTKNEKYSIIALPTYAVSDFALESMDHLLKKRTVQMYELLDHVFVRKVV